MPHIYIYTHKKPKEEKKIETNKHEETIKYKERIFKYVFMHVYLNFFVFNYSLH